MITNKYNNISSQDALFNNVTIRDTLKSDSIEANEIVKSSNPESTGRIILNGTLTVSGNDNSIDTIKNVNITNNELKFTNESGTTTANKITQENGITNITGGNITFNHTLEVTGENHNITTISDANITNNKEMEFINQEGNTTIDNITGESSISNGNISFNNVLTVTNAQNDQNNITSITDSNITNNNSMTFTSNDANTTINTLQKGEGDLTITGGNINTNNIIIVTEESTITSITDANITNSGTITLNKASIDQLITSIINGPKTEKETLTKFKYKEETLKKSTNDVIGTKYYNIPYVKEEVDEENNKVTYYGELVNKTEELDESNNEYDMKYYYADIIYYQYHNKIIIPDDDIVDVKKADQISLIDADVTNNGTLNITDGSVIQEIIGDVKFSGKVNLEAVTEIRDVDNIILEDAIITNNKGITITGESMISSITNSNIGGNVTINTTDQVSIDNINNSTITDGNVIINGDITSTVTNSNLINSTVKLGDDDNKKTLTVKVNEGTEENEIINTITNSTIDNANVTLNNNITSTVTNSNLNATTIDLNSNTLTTKKNETSTFDKINNSTITNGNVTINNDLETLLTDAVLGDGVNNNVNINLNKNSLTAKTDSSISDINKSTLTNGTVIISNDITSKVTDSNIISGTVDLNGNKLTADGDIKLINITGGNITNTGTIEAKGTITASQINSNLLKDQTGTNQIMAYDKNNKKITFCNHTTLTCSGEEDTLTTDNLVIDRITLNEVREVDGGIITTNLKVGTPYTADLGTEPQETSLNVKGNVLHVIIQSVNNVNHYFLLISTNDIENSLKSDDTKIIAKGTDFETSKLISSIDGLTLKLNEHLFIKTNDDSIANGKELNDRIINATINSDGVITGKSLQSNQLSNEDGNKSLIKYDSINNKITLGDSNAELEIIGFDQKNIDCETLKASNYVQSNLLQSNDGNNKSIIKYESGSTDKNPKITLGSEGIDLEIVGFDQKNIVCETLTATDRIKTNLINSLDDTLPLLSFTKSTNTVTIGSSNTITETNDLKVGNITYTNNIYSNSTPTQPLFMFDASTSIFTIGNATINTFINKVCTNTIRNYSNTLDLFSYNNSSLELGNTNSNYLYTLIHKIRTTDPLYISSLNYWNGSNLTNSVSLMNYDSTNKTITIGDPSIPTMQKMNGLTVDTGIYTNNIYSNTTDKYSLLKYENSSTITKKITLGSASTTQETNNLTVTTNLTVNNYIYSDRLYSKVNQSIPLLYYGSNYLTIGSTVSSYLYTLIRKFRSQEPLGLSSIYYWSTSDTSLSIPLLVYDNTSSTITIGNESTNINIPNLNLNDLDCSSLSISYFGTVTGSNLGTEPYATINTIQYPKINGTIYLTYGKVDESIKANSCVIYSSTSTTAQPITNYRVLIKPTSAYYMRINSVDYQITFNNVKTTIIDPIGIKTNNLSIDKLSDTNNNQLIESKDDTITIGNDDQITIIKNMNYEEVYQKFYVNTNKVIRYQLQNTESIDTNFIQINTSDSVKTSASSSTVIRTTYQNKGKYYYMYNTGKIFINTASVNTYGDLYVITKDDKYIKANFQARLCFVFCNFYFAIKAATTDDSYSSGLWISHNGITWLEWNPSRYNNDYELADADKFNIELIKTITSLKIGYISETFTDDYSLHAGHYALGFPTNTPNISTSFQLDTLDDFINSRLLNIEY